ncbi:hypothetical protein [Bacillus toyonensis]|uniref:hypothetical protein n=1 Tax=Bacillus toyonensis TaxID=155322 RepID=UPI0011420D68|nr:hypothetical protein [Bacillus toyonensis]
MEIVVDVFYKIFIGLISGLIMLFFKPVRRRFKKTKLYSFIMKKLGKERYKVIVTGRIFHNSNLRSEMCSFKVELPYKDISQNAMPIDQSNDLIIGEVNKKYGKKFSSREHFLNNIACKNVTYYQKDED